MQIAQYLGLFERFTRLFRRTLSSLKCQSCVTSRLGKGRFCIICALWSVKPKQKVVVVWWMALSERNFRDKSRRFLIICEFIYVAASDEKYSSIGVGFDFPKRSDIFEIVARTVFYVT